MNGQPDGLVSVAAAARRLGRHRSHVYRLIREGAIKAVVERGDYRIRERELSRYLDGLERPRKARAS